ncbi:hypothetical protein [Corynebacterium sp.]|uniref:hypothetical protein n=1 Tax=Corynebacterium sp. TaxID=1720 RepID=UPI002647448D|nr:hypothetical protein [Corynebacterium sp.]MDN6137045.1 hypothetical protein [Corynebacterium sp.]MDN6737196.1 hypothetical protein [Corynebacterium sp.]
MNNNYQMLDDLMQDMHDRNTVRIAMTDWLIGGHAPGDAWQARDPRRTTVEGSLRSEALVLGAALDLLREDVQEARDEGLPEDTIIAALDLPSEIASLVLGEGHPLNGKEN